MGDLVVHDRETGERGRETNFAQAWQRALKMLSICHSQLAACFQRAKRRRRRKKKLRFLVRSVLYLIPPHHRRLGENLIAELLE